MDPDGSLFFTVLGPVRGWRGSSELSLGSPQQRAALAILLLHGDQPVDIEELVLGLWGENPPKAAVGAARTYVSRLRTALEPEHRDGDGPRLLVSVGTSYLLRLPKGALDVDLVEQDIAAAAVARGDGDLHRAHELLGQAERRWQGTALTGVTGPYTDNARDRLAQRQLALVEQRIELDLELGEAASAVADLTRLTTEHPLRENLRELQMRALYQSGRQAEALAVFADIRHVLASELGVAPDQRLHDLQQRILRGDPALLPEQRPAEAAPAGPVPTQLPADTADFTGRGDLVESIAGVLTERQGQAVPVYAVSGIGGAGKTALAVRVAHSVRGRFPDGQLYIDLAGASSQPLSPFEVLGYFLRSLGVAEKALPVDQAGRSALYRTVLADRHVLIVLDNAHDAGQVVPLLPGYPGCSTIITSRARLSVPTAATIELDAFDPAEALRLLTTIVGEDKVLAEAAAAGELLASCGHLPLAVRVIAGQLVARPDMLIADVLRLLSDERLRLSRLHSGELDVRATFRLGYDQLDPQLARAFRLLSLPDAETVPLAAAAALLGLHPDDAEDEIDQLIDTGLVQTPRSGRYRLHDLLRLFARERSTEQDAPADLTEATHRLLDFLLATARNAYLAVRPGNRIVELLQPLTDVGVRFSTAAEADAWFRQEREFVLSVLRQAAQRHPELIGITSDVLLGLDPLMERSFAWQQCIGLARLIASTARQAGLREAEAAARYMLSGALWQMGELDPAMEEIEIAVERACRVNPLVLAESLVVQGLVAGDSAMPEEEIRLLRLALELQRQTGNRSAEANNLGNLTAVCLQLGQTREAYEHSRKALALYRELGDVMGEAHAMLHNGVAAHQLGRLDEAERHYREALALTDVHGLAHMRAALLSYFARLHLDRGDVATAAAAADEAIVACVEIGYSRGQAHALATLGRALEHLGEVDHAVACLRAAADLFGRVGVVGSEDIHTINEEIARITRT